MLGQLGDFSVRQTAIGFSDCGQLAGRLITDREGVVAQEMIALAVAELSRHHDDIKGRQFLL